MKNEEKAGTISNLSRTTLVAAILITVIALGGVSWLIYRPSIPGPPPPIIPSETTPTETEPTTEPVTTENTTSPEIEPETINATDIILETPELNETITITEVTAEELLYNVGMSLIPYQKDEVTKAKEWLHNISAIESFRVTGLLAKQDIEEGKNLATGDKLWIIYLKQPEDAGTWIKIYITNATELQKFKDLNLNQGDKFRIEGKFGGISSVGWPVIKDCKIVQKIIEP